MNTNQIIFIDNDDEDTGAYETLESPSRKTILCWNIFMAAVTVGIILLLTGVRISVTDSFPFYIDQQQPEDSAFPAYQQILTLRSEDAGKLSIGKEVHLQVENLTGTTTCNAVITAIGRENRARTPVYVQLARADSSRLTGKPNGKMMTKSGDISILDYLKRKLRQP